MKATQEDMILDHLKTGRSLTSLECLERFGCMRLASRISDLKREGYDIKSENVKDERSGKHYAKYSLITKEVNGQKEMMI